MNGLPGLESCAGLLVLVIVQVTAIAAVGLLLAGCLRSAAHRHGVLLATLLGILVGPALLVSASANGLSLSLPLLPAPPVEVIVSTSPPSTPVVEPPQPVFAEPLPVTPTTTEFEPAIATPAEPPSRPVVWPQLDQVLIGLWAVGAALGLAGILRAAWGTQRLLASVRPLDVDTHADDVEAARRQLGVTHFPRVGTTGKVAGPAVAGLWGRYWILIPLRFLETLVRDELVQVLVHEGAHVVRRDPLIVLLQRLTASLFWWHPLIHVLNRQLTRAREEICDNFVLQHVNPETYSATLLRLATLSPPTARTSLAVALLDPHWNLEDRIRGILDPNRSAATRVRLVTAVSVVAAFVLLPTLLGVTRVVAQTPQDPAVRVAQAQPGQPVKPPAVEKPAEGPAISFELTYVGDSDKPFYTLRLQALPAMEAEKDFALSRNLSVEEAATLTEHLTTTGFFRRAQAEPPKGAGPHYVLHVQRGSQHSYASLGWQLPMLQQLDRLRKVLKGSPADAMDRLLGRMAGLRVAWMADLELAKKTYREQRGEERLKAVNILYPVIEAGTTRNEVLNLLGSPDGTKDGQLTRFFNYVVAEGKTIEIEFNPDKELVVRKREQGLGLDPPPGPALEIPDNLKPYLKDYTFGKATLRAGFVPGKPELVWGEPLEVNFQVENVGEEDFQFLFGGDYRGSGRHNRFKIDVADEAGKLLPDPRENAPDFGGIASFQTITPGGLPFQRTIDLTHFRTITKPGKYTVTCRFGFDDEHAPAKPKPTVTSSFSLVILERTAERVGRILDDLVTKVIAAENETRDAAMARIAQFGKDDAVPRLAWLANEGPMVRRISAYAALPQVSTDASEDIALAGLNHSERAIRSAAASALGQFKRPRGIEALLTAFPRESAPVNAEILMALGTTQSPQALPVIVESLNSGTLNLKAAGLQALTAYGGEAALTELRKHVVSDDLDVRYKALKAWEHFRQPMEPEWLLPILMTRTLNDPPWYDSRRMIRLYCGDKAVPTLLSALDFDIAWSLRNWWIFQELEACAGAPKVQYEHDPNSDGTPEQWEKNRQVLAQVKPLAGPIPKAPPLPKKEPVPELKTDPPIDFKPVFTEVPKAIQIKSGFFQIRLNRNSSNYTYEPSPEHAKPYNTRTVILAMLKDPAKLAQSGITAEKAERLRKLSQPPDNVSVDGSTSLMYGAWRESPPGPIQERARENLGDAVRRASQNYHTAVVAFATAAEAILNDTAPAEAQQRLEAPSTGVAEIHPKMRDSDLWRDLQQRLAKSAVPFRRVDIDEQGRCRLNLGETATTDISFLKGAMLDTLILSNTAVRDLSALEGMFSLRVLDLSGSPVESLAPLKGLKLKRLNLTGTKVKDLSPLAEAELIEFVAIGPPVADLAPLANMPLTYVDLRRTHVTSLAPLVKMPLTSLQIEASPIAELIRDLSPLRDLPLKTLWLTGFKDRHLPALQRVSATRLVLGGRGITDLSPLSSLSLEDLTLDQTGVRDLTPLKGMPLKALHIVESPVTDLSPLLGMQLTSLSVSEPGTDLAPLEGMPLERVGLPDVSTVKNLEVLRKISTLKHLQPPQCKPIPSAEFWRDYDAGERYQRW